MSIEEYLLDTGKSLENEMTDYIVVYSAMRRRQLEAFLAANPNPDYVVWLTGSCEWQVRVYNRNAI